MKGICGLANVGNSCYINASLQIFSQIHELNQYLLTVQNVKNKIDSVVTFEWILLYKMFQDNHGTIVPNRFIEKIKQVSIQKTRDEFSGREQGDSVEFFEFMLECMHNSLNGLDDSLREKRSLENPIEKYLDQIEKKDHSIIQNLFLCCSVNRYINPITQKIEFDRIEHEYRISLSIPEKDNVSIKDCFIDTFKEELLTGDNAWFDDKENVKKTVIKRSYLCYCPPILVLQLKRWKSNLTKKNVKIDTPFTLDIQPFTIYKERCEYELFGIINHEGSIHGGHYYVCIKINGGWVSVNDNLIQPISHENIIHEINYCLFYRKIK
jgi:ubiquitin carboxyl-terminal hydrolase 8